nr:MAG TPA: Bacterial DNA-binding protein [Caudoviricetes sp.]
MIKIDLVREIVTRATDKGTCTYTQADVLNIIDSFVEIVQEKLSADKEEKIPLFGLGNFIVKHIPEKSGVINMGDKKGQAWSKPAHDEIAFKVTSSVKTI